MITPFFLQFCFSIYFLTPVHECPRREKTLIEGKMLKQKSVDITTQDSAGLEVGVDFTFQK